MNYEPVLQRSHLIGAQIMWRLNGSQSELWFRVLSPSPTYLLSLSLSLVQSRICKCIHSSPLARQGGGGKRRRAIVIGKTGVIFRYTRSMILAILRPPFFSSTLSSLNELQNIISRKRHDLELMFASRRVSDQAHLSPDLCLPEA